MPTAFQLITPTRKRLFAALLFALAICGNALAQSTEADFPTPITANEISGRIAARDIGDPRLTRQFYILNATPGDLLITVESGNLNGDVDLFTAVGLRPLAKVSVYAGDSNTKATKSIFLKQRQQLILRVEARSANDNDGAYRIRFEGSFEPLSGASPTANASATPPAPEVSASRASKNGTRVSSTGARIPEEIKEPTAEAKKETAATEAPPATVAEAKPPKSSTESPVPARRTRPVNVPRSRPVRKPDTASPARTTVPRARPSTARPSTAAKRPTTAAPTTKQPVPPKAAAPPPAPERPAAPSPRLIVELRDGAKSERFMTTVRRVTIDNNQLVIVGKDGKIERQPLANVLRFTIEP